MEIQRTKGRIINYETFTVTNNVLSFQVIDKFGVIDKPFNPIHTYTNFSITVSLIDLIGRKSQVGVITTENYLLTNGIVTLDIVTDSVLDFLNSYVYVFDFNILNDDNNVTPQIALSQLTDTSLNQIIPNLQLLSYDTTLNKWTNKAISDLPLKNHTLEEHTNINIFSGGIEDNQSLIFDKNTNDFRNRYINVPNSGSYKYLNSQVGLPVFGEFQVLTTNLYFNINKTDRNSNDMTAILSTWSGCKSITIQNITNVSEFVVLPVAVNVNQNPLLPLDLGSVLQFTLSSIPVNIIDLEINKGYYITPQFNSTVTAVNSGSGSFVFRDKQGDQLAFRSLVEGSGINLTETSNTITIEAPIQMPNVVNQGAGEGIYINTTGNTINLKTLRGNDNLTIDSNQPDSIEIKAPYTSWKYRYISTGIPGVGEFLIDQGVITINQEDLNGNIMSLLFGDTRSLILRWIDDNDQSLVIVVKTSKQGLTFNNNEYSGDVVENIIGAVASGSDGFVSIQTPNVLSFNDLIDGITSNPTAGDLLQYDVNSNSWVNGRKFSPLAFPYSFRLATGAPNGGEVLLSTNALAISRTSTAGFATQLTLANLRVGSYLTFIVEGDQGRYASCRITTNPVLVSSLYFTCSITNFVNVGINTGDIVSVGLEFGMGDVSFGSCTVRNNATATTIATQKTILTDNSNFFKVLGTTTLRLNNEFTMPVSNRLTYTGPFAKNFKVQATFSGISSGNDIGFYFTIVKNGTLFDNVIISNDFHQVQLKSTTISTDVNLATNDFVELFVANVEGTQTITIQHLCLSANQI